MFDIADFYPSISEKLLTCALDYASKFTTIQPHEREVVVHARKSLLFDSSQPWTKKNNTNMFDVTMGSLDGAEVCELVGLFILDKLTKCFANQNIGLYRDDGLAVFRNMGPRTAEKIKKRFMLCFEDIELKITVQSNIKVVNYLDITLNLSNGKFYPYRKPNDKPLYINTRSNHPPSIIKQLPSGINKRISSLSCNAEEFEKAIPAYNDALQKSGFTQRLAFNDKINTDTEKSKKKSRHRNILWFNPPYSESVQTNVGQKIPEAGRHAFPQRPHPA